MGGDTVTVGEQATRQEQQRRAILLVDDEQRCLMAGERLLGLMGYEGILAADGQTALERYRQRRGEIDLVILDLIMPFMDGVETFRQLKAIDPEVRILIASGYLKSDQRDALSLAGAAGFLQKPYDYEMFDAEVRRAMAFSLGSPAAAGSSDSTDTTS